MFHICVIIISWTLNTVTKISQFFLWSSYLLVYLISRVDHFSRRIWKRRTVNILSSIHRDQDFLQSQQHVLLLSIVIGKLTGFPWYLYTTLLQLYYAIGFDIVGFFLIFFFKLYLFFFAFIWPLSCKSEKSFFFLSMSPTLAYFLKHLLIRIHARQ